METAFNEAQVHDLAEMHRDVPAIQLARLSFISKCLSEPFTFSIPAIGLDSNKDMEKIVSAYWMPFLRKVFDWVIVFGVCPYYLDKPRETIDHKVPVVPDVEMGFATVSIDDRHRVRYRWYWTHGTTTLEEKNMLWVTTECSPTIDGHIRSPLASLLPNYRALLILRASQSIVATQSARPVHIIEHVSGKGATQQSDDLVQLTADFSGKAAGISRARREQARQQEIRMRTAELHQHLRQQQMHNTARTTMQQALWTDTGNDLLEEMDAGFSNRVVTLRPDYTYKQAATPTMAGDYYEAEKQFNLYAAAIMGVALEKLTPTGTSRTQNVEGADSFESERIRANVAFFASVAQSALVIAYRDWFKEAMDGVRQWRVQSLHGNPQNVAFLEPELDVQVDMSISSNQSYAVLKNMHADGLIQKQTFGEHALKGVNMPRELLHVSDWPDRVAKELLVGPAKDPAAVGSKPSKKKKPKTK
jgi:hypothetical protein